MAPKTPVIALIGSESLMGRELRDIAATSTPELTLKLIAAEDEQPGALTRVGDMPAVVGGLDADSLAGARAVVLAGGADSSRKALELLDADGDTAVIDLTGFAEERPDARLRAPLVEGEDESEDDAGARVHVIAHPAAIALALFLRRLHEHDPIRRSVVEIFAPASEHDARGVQELQQQTISLFSFQNLPRAVFDAQLSFNLLPRYGEEAPASLADTELRIERHLATLLALPGEGSGAPLPSLRLIQAPVFHGYSISAWVEFDGNPGVEALEASLAAGSIEVRTGEFEPPTNVGQAGQGGIAVGAVSVDRNNPEACWFWLVADNLRLAAENAAEVARQLP
ncbi:MAG TPA: Asd/ArgC dimerization domain-containing protein [Bryobacteraceae bacterium]|jgi:aspartate-semialdehyde dehydrogenase